MVTKCGSTEQETKGRSIITFPLCKYYHFFFSFSNTFFSCLSLLSHSFWSIFSPPFLSLKCCVHGKAPQTLVIFITLWKIWLYKRGESPVIFIWEQIHPLFFILQFRQDSTLQLVESVSTVSITKWGHFHLCTLEITVYKHMFTDIKYTQAAH